MSDRKTGSFLAVDLGAESGRAVLGRVDGGRISMEEIRRFPNTPLRLSGHMFWDIYGLLGEIKKGLADCRARLGHSPSSIGIDTWGVDFGLLAGDGSVLGLPFCYRDVRNEGAMEGYFKLVPPRSLYEATGIQFLPFNTLFQLYAMVRDGSPLLAAASSLLFMPDLFSYLLTGRRVCEFTIASTSQMLDPQTRQWRKDLFQAMGFSRDILGEVVEPGTVIGPLSPETASETGLEAVPVIAVAGHDTASAVAAVPASGDDWAYISSGTWSLVGIEAGRPLLGSGAFEKNFTNEGGVAGTTRFLKNVTGLWLLQGCRRSWASTGRRYSYEELAEAAAGAPAFACLIDPDHPLFLNPPDMVEAVAAFCRLTGQKPPDSPASTARAVFESLALKYRLVLDDLKSITGRPISTVHVIGGGSKNGLLGRFTASAAGAPVVAGPAEATALGNISLQAMALGVIKDISGARAMIADSFQPVRYEPGFGKGWEAALSRFRDICASAAQRTS